jgi:hypothetical protein
MAILFFLGAGIAMWLHAEQLARGSGPHPDSVYWLAVALVSVAFALYGLRERFRLIYGLLELAIGAVILLGALNSYTATIGRQYVPIVGGGVFVRPPEGWLQWNANSSALLAVLAAVYIIVRGLDNVGEGFHQLRSPLWTRIWRFAFPNRKRNVANHAEPNSEPGTARCAASQKHASEEASDPEVAPRKLAEIVNNTGAV